MLQCSQSLFNNFDNNTNYILCHRFGGQATPNFSSHASVVVQFLPHRKHTETRVRNGSSRNRSRNDYQSTERNSMRNRSSSRNETRASENSNRKSYHAFIDQQLELLGMEKARLMSRLEQLKLLLSSMMHSAWIPIQKED